MANDEYWDQGAHDEIRVQKTTLRHNHIVSHWILEDPRSAFSARKKLEIENNGSHTYGKYRE